MLTKSHFLQAVMPSWPVLLTVWIVVAIGAAVQLGKGMGFGLTAGPVLALLDAPFIPGTRAIGGVAVNPLTLRGLS